MPREIPVPLRLCWSDPATGEARSVPLEGALRFGSNRQQNDVVLPLRSVEAFHAEIVGNREGGWELVATGSRRLKVGDEMTARARLTAGTEFSIGPVAFRVRPAEAQARRPVSSTGSRRAFAPPPPPPPSQPAAPLALVALLAAATALVTWSALHERAGRAPDAAAHDAASAEAPSGKVHPKPRAPGRTSRLEAGSVATFSTDARGGTSAAPVILVKLAGSWMPVQGFFVTPEGLVITNQRLTAAAEEILVRAAGADAPAPARVVASDAERDLALLEVPVSAPVQATRLDDDGALLAAARALGVPPADVRAFVAAHR